MKKKNIKIITIYVENETYLTKINSTFTLRNLFHSELQVGNNIYHCNHSNYSQIKRMQCNLFKIINEL